MPRTKVVKKTAIQEPDENEIKLKGVLQHLQNKKKEMLSKLKEEEKNMLIASRNFINEQICSIPLKYVDKTIREIIDLETQVIIESVNCISKEDLLNITKTVKKDRTTLKRSTSFVDEGYLTAESVHSGGRRSRSKTKVVKNTRQTRSLSRNNAHKTPANRVTPPNSYGVVTPKCNPSTPQILLRRPKMGEVALSMQGSPLYTASVVNDNKANINIPLLDGRLLTLQPQRGLRMSQIPQFDPETLRQLETLRENLSQVCAASGVNMNSA